jgi:hypothetical protein
LGDDASILSRIGKEKCIETFEAVPQKRNGELIDILITISMAKDFSGKIIRAYNSPGTSL